MRQFTVLELIYIPWLTLLPIALSGQVYEFADPVKLSDKVNSSAEEIMPIVSPDGNTLYFSRVLYEENTGGRFAGSDIWVSHRINGEWFHASNSLPWNNKDNNAIIGISEHQKIVHLLTGYNQKRGIAFSKHLNGHWTEPEIIPIKGLSKRGFTGFYMNTTYDILLLSMEGNDSYGEEDLFVSLREEDEWSFPVNLGPTINTGGFEISPFLSKDGKTLFFASNGHDGYGDADIYVSTRQYNSWQVWSAPKNLGTKINSESFDAYLTVAPDSQIYFTSNKEAKMTDIYSTRIKKTGEDISKEEISELVQEAKELISKLQIENVNLDEKKTKDRFLIFQPNSSELTEKTKNMLDFTARILKLDSQIKKVVLKSYSNDYNNQLLDLRLARERAELAKEYLVASGVNPNQVEVKLSYQNLEEQNGIKIDFVINQ